LNLDYRRTSVISSSLTRINHRNVVVNRSEIKFSSIAAVCPGCSQLRAAGS
jgi:hypothetical protein